MMNISTDEYKQRRSIFEHCNWLKQKLRDFESTPDFYESYLERKGLNVKRLLEEAVPVAFLGLHFWRPWYEVAVTCLAGSEPYDAVLELQKQHEEARIIRVEVTTTETEETTMRRQALARNSIAAINGLFAREGRTIDTVPVWESTIAQRQRILDRAFERFCLKAEREQDPQTAILVYVESPLVLPAWQRYQLVERTQTYLLEHRPTLYGVYYCYDTAFGVDGLRNDRNELWNN